MFETRQDKIVGYISNIILVIAALIVLYPLCYVLSASFSDPVAVSSGKMWLWPVQPTLEGYKTILNETKIWMGYLNSIIYTVMGTSLNVLVTMCAAYALSRRDLPYRNGIMIFFMITMFFGGGLIPSYLLNKTLGLLDNRLVMIIPGMISVWNMTIARTFIQTNIPDELIEAAKIDGCSYFKSFGMIVLPLSKAIIAVLVLYYGIGHWNSYFGAMIYLSDPDKFPLQVILREMLIQAQATEEMMDSTQAQEVLNKTELIKYATIVVSSVPTLIIYPFLQKYFVQGVMVGALKG